MPTVKRSISAGVVFAALCVAQNVVVQTPTVGVVEGSLPIRPANGAGGTGTSFNYLPYIVPGQYADPVTGEIKNDPFDISYSTSAQPVQTSDWWTGIGLQWSGWVVGRTVPEGQVGRSNGFISEPFQMQFLDVTPNSGTTIAGIPLPIHGLRFWNQNAISVKTDGKIFPKDAFDPSNNFAGRGEVARQTSPVVTVGLANVHPLGADPRQKAPWSNIKVKGYTDWGVVMSYVDQGSEMTITLANGSPFAWMERTQGAAPFTVWAGEVDSDVPMARTVWYSQDGVIGLTIATAYNPYNGLTKSVSTAAYVVFADQGAWLEQKATTAAASMFTNPSASRVAVLALPHNIDPANAMALIAAMKDLQQYSCQKIADTKVHYPPIPGSDATVSSGGQTLPLGYNQAGSLVRMKLQVTTAAFPLAGCSAGGIGLQLAFPHHRKTMVAADKANLLSYTWNGVIGQLQAYKGASYVREIRTKGVLPFLPSVAVNSGIPSAADDIYQTMKTWFFLEEPVPASDGHLDSFVRNLGLYVNVQTNTYIQNTAALYESVVIADQLSKSSDLAGAMDQDLGKSKREVAAEMRDGILQSLKELIGQWSDVYTTQFLQYNSQYDSTFGFPDGYGSVQNFNDHHFHYGYFLRAAAMIGRFDPDWLTQYLPLIDRLRRDVATYDRGDMSYPFLREFSPFYGHSWANGTSDAGGNDQESTSEAVNFAAGLLELGELLGNNDWRDLGLYLYEEEILGAEQYWFNQDGDLSKSSGTLYNGNWPDALVHFTGPDASPWKTTLITNAKQFGVFRNTFFGGVNGTYAIQAIPLSAPTLYLGRNQAWLAETWKQYLLDTTGQPEGIYEVVAAGLQARLAGGSVDSLARLNRLHKNFAATTNTMGKNWVYANAQLGQIDASVVADTPSYGVFSKAGTRTYVAYNPTAAPKVVNFTDTVTGGKVALSVAAASMATAVATGQPSTDVLTPYAADPERLYLRSAGTLLHAPGAWVDSPGTLPFPSDTSALQPSLKVVPARPDAGTSTPLILPDPAFVQTWTGNFAGQLTGGAKALTRFAIYTNQSLFPGWQQDPSKVPNVVSLRFVYDFDSDNKADRVEILQNVTLVPGDSFIYKNKITEYYFDQILGGANGQIPVFIGDGKGGGAAPFPPSVTNGTVTVQMYGGSGGQVMAAVPVSVETAPILNRASWVKPPYEKDSGANPTALARALRAIAGPKNTVALTNHLTLDGSRSTSADGKPLKYAWTVIGRPASLSKADTAKPTVQFGSGVGPYTFRLVVTDSAGNTATDTVTVTFQHTE